MSASLDYVYAGYEAFSVVLEWSNTNPGRLDVWDPDTDDDGLTDGQELSTLTRVHQPVIVTPGTGVGFGIRQETLGTTPVDPDHDGDGYWDGWIGVYGVGRSDDVITYMENLEDGDGIESGEMVSEQVGVHEVTSDPLTHSNKSVELYGAGNGHYHSNIHVGELHWRDVDNSEPGDPTDDTVTPSPAIELEVDYDDDVTVGERSAVQGIVENFGLYGVSVGLTMDDSLDDKDLDAGLFEWDNEKPPTSRDDADEIEEEFHDDSDAIYMLLTTEPGNSWIPWPDWEGRGGVASSDGDGRWGRDFGTVVFVKVLDENWAPHDSQVRETAVHEVGHIMGIGREDDGPTQSTSLNEVYSGSDSDSTPERVEIDGIVVRRWSTMSAGYRVPMTDPPINNDYAPFSIEELTSLETNNMYSETHSKWNT